MQAFSGVMHFHFQNFWHAPYLWLNATNFNWVKKRWNDAPWIFFTYNCSTNYKQISTKITRTQTRQIQVQKLCFHSRLLTAHAHVRAQGPSKSMHCHLQNCIPLHIWILLFMLVIRISPSSCSGACSKMHIHWISDSDFASRLAWHPDVLQPHSTART